MTNGWKISRESADATPVAPNNAGAMLSWGLGGNFDLQDFEVEKARPWTYLTRSFIGCQAAFGKFTTALARTLHQSFTGSTAARRLARGRPHHHLLPHTHCR